jgi:hypothetical protein
MARRERARRLDPGANSPIDPIQFHLEPTLQ